MNEVRCGKSEMPGGDYQGRSSNYRRNCHLVTSSNIVEAIGIAIVSKNKRTPHAQVVPKDSVGSSRTIVCQGIDTMISSLCECALRVTDKQGWAHQLPGIVFFALLNGRSCSCVWTSSSYWICGRLIHPRLPLFFFNEQITRAQRAPEKQMGADPHCRQGVAGNRETGRDSSGWFSRNQNRKTRKCSLSRVNLPRSRLPFFGRALGVAIFLSFGFRGIHA